MPIGNDLSNKKYKMKRQKTTLKSYFQTGDIPTQSQYENLIDSFRHLDDKVPLTDLDGMIAQVNVDNQFSSLQTFNNGAFFNGSTTIEQAEIQNGINVIGLSSFENDTQFNGHIRLGYNKWLQSQYSVTDDELRLNANNAGGWDFYNQTQAEFADIRAKGGDFKGNVTFRGINAMYSLPETDRRLTFNGNIAETYNIYYYDEGNHDFHPVIIGGNSNIDTGFKVFANGDAQPSGTYKSSDGTPGYNGVFTVGTYDITVKNGLITNVVDIS
jgi:hypothetical protein